MIARTCRYADSLATAMLPFSALVRRELLRHLRRVRVFFMLAAFPAALMYLTVQAWPTTTRISAEYAAILTDGFTAGFPMMLLLAGGVVLPAYAAMSLRSERDRDTFDLMRLTLLTPFSILAGTVFNAVGLFLIAVLATLPMAAVVYGVLPIPWYALPLKTAVVCSAALTAASSGVFAATLYRRTSDALGVAYYLAFFAIIGVVFLPVGLVIALVDLVIAPNSAVYSLVFPIRVSPIAAIFFDSMETPWGLPALGPVGLPVVSFLSQLATSAIVLYWAKRRLTNFDPEIKPKENRFASAGRPARVYPPITYRDGRNPIFMREFTAACRRAQINAASVSAAVIFVLVGWGLSIPLSLGALRPSAFDASPLTFCFLLSVFVPALLVPGLAAPSWVNEREADVEELLKLTLLTSRERAFGKAAGALALPGIGTLCVLLAGLPLLGTARHDAEGISLVVVGMSAAFFALCMPFAIARQVARLPLAATTAAVATYGATALYLMSPYLVRAVLGSDVPAPVVYVVTAMSPLTAVLHATRAMPGEAFGYPIGFLIIQSMLLSALVWTDLRREHGKHGGGSAPRNDATEPAR